MPSVRRNDLDIHFTVRGGGPPIVLGHSFLCSGDMWASQAAALSQQFQVINIDARGHGRSGHIQEDFTLYDMVDDVLAVLDQLGLERVVWAGLSVGGMVGIRAALTVPRRISALILVDTDAGVEPKWNRFKFSAMGLMSKAVGIRPFLPQIVRLMFGKTTRRHKPELVADWTERFSSVHLPSLIRMLKALNGRDDVVARLPEITAPALVLVGKEDETFPPSHSQLLSRELPDSSLVEIAEAGHLSALEQPEAVTAAMFEFLEETS